MLTADVISIRNLAIGRRTTRKSVWQGWESTFSAQTNARYKGYSWSIPR